MAKLSCEIPFKDYLVEWRYDGTYQRDGVGGDKGDQLKCAAISPALLALQLFCTCVRAHIMV
jgi:hypothetical protein